MYSSSGLPRTATGLLVAAVRSVLSVELDAAERVRAVTDPVESLGIAAAFIAAVDRHRVAQLLAPHSQRLGLAPEIGDALLQAERRATLAAMATLADTIGVSSTLVESGVPHLIVKGVALSQQTTGSPFARACGDVDVLVAVSDIARAATVLGQSGMARFSGSPAPESVLFGAIQRTQKELLMLRQGRQVDLHWRLDNARASLQWEFKALIESADWVDLSGVSVPTLSRPHATILNASHGTSDAWSRIRAIVDQARLQQGLDGNLLGEEARAVGAGRRLELSMRMIALLLGTHSPERSTTLRVIAERMWAWILAGQEPLNSSTPGAAGRRFAVHVLAYDTLLAAAQRTETLLWPVEAMTRRSLGDAGDRHPWLYVAATPYFLPQRVLDRRGS